ncbi:MAG: fibronectin type III domain-containing protein [Chloroflexi bacterium]|nr:MAG: fibronectin type III domain-containing protein [Chloroflexota bacterium]
MKRSFINLFIIIMILASLIASGDGVTPVHALGSMEVVPSLPPSLPGELIQGYLVGVWGASSTSVFAVGSGNSGYGTATLPLIYRKNDTIWTSVIPPLPPVTPAWNTGSLEAVWGSGDSNVFAVGSGGQDNQLNFPLLSRWNGSTWTSSSPGLPAGFNYGHLYDVWGSGASNVFAVGDGGHTNSTVTYPLLYRYNGSTWTSSSLPLPDGWGHGYLRAVWGSSASNVYAVGFGDMGSASIPLLYHYNGSTWSFSTPSLPTEDWGSGYLNGVWGSGTNDIYAVGSGNNGSSVATLLYHYDGSSWTSSSLPSLSGWSTIRLYSIWGSSANDVYIVGSGIHEGTTLPLLYRKTINGWAASNFLPTGWSSGHFDGIWGSSTTEVYAVGSGRVPNSSGGVDDVPLLARAGPDEVDPGAVNELLATPGPVIGSVNLRWKAPADDAGNNNSGPVDSYLVKYSTSSLADCTGGTPITSGLPLPAAPTTIQAMTISGLTMGEQYYFAVCALDEEDNPSEAATTSAKATARWMHDDLDAGWTYSSGFSILANPGAYLDGIHTVATIGKYAEFTFTGSQFDVLYTANTNRGKVNVFVNGIPIGTMDQYSPTKVLQARWPSRDLGPGDHTVKLVHAGPSGSVMNIDAIEVGDYIPPDGGTYDDLDARWTYSSGFSILANPGAYLDGIHSSTTPDSYAEFTFYGSQFEVLYTANFNRGIATVLVNDLPIGTMDQFSPTKVLQARWPSGDLGPGVHKVKLIHAGPSGSVINIDAIVVPAGPGTYDDLDASWIYSSGFGILANPGAYLDGIHSSTTVGNYAEFTFTGSQFDLLYTANFNRGTADVLVDGLSIGTMDQYSLDRVFQARWPSGDLGPGVHTVKVVHTGPSGSVINIDAIDVP